MSRPLLCRIRSALHHPSPVLPPHRGGVALPVIRIKNRGKSHLSHQGGPRVGHASPVRRRLSASLFDHVCRPSRIALICGMTRQVGVMHRVISTRMRSLLRPDVVVISGSRATVVKEDVLPETRREVDVQVSRLL
jgi:hypothetical protein